MTAALLCLPIFGFLNILMSHTYVDGNRGNGVKNKMFVYETRNNVKTFNDFKLNILS